MFFTAMSGSKILINVPNLEFPGGVAAVFKALDLEEAQIADHFCIHDNQVEKSNLLRFVRLAKKFIIYLNLINKYDVVMLNPSLDQKSFFRDGLFSIIGRLKGKKVIVFWHGWEDEFEAKIKNSLLLNLYFKNSFAKAQSFIVLGQIFKKKLLSMGVSESKQFFSFFNIADDSFINKFNINERKRLKSKFNILVLSRIEKNKGVYLAIDTFEKIQKIFPDKFLQLTIAGDGSDLMNVTQYVAKRKIKNVEFAGFVKGVTKHEVYKNAHLYLFPTSFGEGLPVSVLEAMLYGMPIITRPVGGLPDVIKNNINGYLIDSVNPRDFIQPIKTLMLNSKLYQSICIKNHAFALNNLIASKARERFSEFLNTI
jgi:glycosyltransferase involved in cell wall biosynthesis